MRWRNVLYFSKGERQALTLLFCLTSVTGFLLIANDMVRKDGSVETHIGVEPVAESAPVVLPAKEKKNRENQEKKNQKNQEKKSRSRKYPAGTVVELNAADTTALKQVPGIGSAFSNRIVKFRTLLGGFYSVSQLREVYGIDEERYEALSPWFRVDSSLIVRLPVNRLPYDSLIRHPYIGFKQARVIERLRKQKGRLSGWENLCLLEEFTAEERERLARYISFD
ncbi:MAG: helix-hairpin-helix domain-containing protein [Tannerellaceae bacterium]|jgi:DNA uptake protein ComE-like DNA-binding protein|nr:helix-hairpin-helix domain-containing protein [Tannerellaceae bacterium]